MLQLIKYNQKISTNIYLVSGIIFLLLIACVFSFRFLTNSEVARITELYVSVVGIIMLVYIPSIECNVHITEVIYGKVFNHEKILLLRIAIVTLWMFLMINGISLWAVYQGADFTYWSIMLGSFISALYLGMIGLTVNNITNNIAVAYMVPFLYYLLEYTSKGKYSKELYLFSMTRNEFSNKYYLLGVIGMMLVINFLIMIYRRNHLK